MKLLGVVGSMRKEGNTYKMVKAALESAREQGAETEVVHISDMNIEPCRACYDQCSKQPYICPLQDDLAAVLDRMKGADAIIIGSPLYFKVPSRLTALAERLVCLAYFHEMRGFTGPEPLEDKPIGFVVATGGGDPRPVFELLFNLALSLKMKPVIMKTFPYFGVAAVGGIEPKEGYDPAENARELGRLLVEATTKM